MNILWIFQRSCPRIYCWICQLWLWKTRCSFLNKYDNDEFSMHNNDGLKLQIIIDNFTEKEISNTIDSLKNNKSPGNDLLPAEFIKACKAELLPLIIKALNYIINNRDFPDILAEGLRSSVFKTGDINNRNNYRGITVLSVFTKNFETAVNNRLNLHRPLHMIAVIDLMGDLLKEVWPVITSSYYRDWLKEKLRWASRFTSVW